MKFSPLKIAASLAILATSASFAQTKAPEPDYTLAYNAGAVSDYRFRGIAQTGLKPAAQAGVDYTNKNGVYLGAFTSNVSWVKDFNGASKGSMEVDLYGGYKGVIAGDLGFDVGAITYQYPGNNSGANGTRGAGNYSNASTTEIYGGLTYSMFALKYNRSTGDFLGNLKSSGSQYFDLTANFDAGNGFTITPHLGRQTIPNSMPANFNNYTDYSLTVAKDLGNGLVASAAAIGTNTKTGTGTAYRDNNGKDLGKSTLVVGLKYNF
jgi:uncharacterized protein (TIGR02001 family)